MLAHAAHMLAWITGDTGAMYATICLHPSGAADVVLHYASDDDATRAAAALGGSLRRVSNGKRTWLVGDAVVGTTAVTVLGVFTDIVASEVTP